MNGSSLINTDSEGLKELDTQAFVKAYGKHVSTVIDSLCRGTVLSCTTLTRVHHVRHCALLPGRT
jgi:hypothetical protein